MSLECEFKGNVLMRDWQSGLKLRQEDYTQGEALNLWDYDIDVSTGYFYLDEDLKRSSIYVYVSVDNNEWVYT